MTGQLKALIEGWQKVVVEWDAQDRESFDGPKMLYLGSVRVMILQQVIRALQSIIPYQEVEFDSWFEIWDTTGNQEIRRLCKIAWDTARATMKV